MCYDACFAPIIPDYSFVKRKGEWYKGIYGNFSIMEDANSFPSLHFMSNNPVKITDLDR